MQTLVLCADDYGLSEGVSRAIAELIAAGRLSATSCMSVAPAWATAAARLHELDHRAEIGLHLTLTDLAPLGPMPGLAPAGRLPSIGRLAAGALAGRLDRAEIRGELTRQLDAFEAALGRAPDFLDGHQHAHALPVVREAVLELFGERLGRERAWIRSCWEPPAWIVRRGVAIGRALALDALTLGFRGACRRRRIPTNDSFRGVNEFKAGSDYRAEFRQWLRGAARRPLVMCHPGHVDDALRRLDPVTDRRAEEYAYLAGPDFPADLAAAGWRLGRMPVG